MPEPRRNVRRLLVALTCLALAVMAGFMLAGFSPTALAREAGRLWSENESAGMDWIARHRAGAAGLLFVGVSVLPAFMLPVSPLLALCGLILGPAEGVLVAGAGMMVNATGTFFLARTCRPWVTAKTNALGFEVPTLSDERLPYLMVPMRVIPGVPFVVQNYLVGLAGVTPRAFLRWLLLLETPCAAPYVWVGAGVAEGHRRYLMLGGALVLAGVFAAHWHRKRLKRPGATRLSERDCT